MTRDNWPAEKKINELVGICNRQTEVIQKLLSAIEESKVLGIHVQIDVQAIRSSSPLKMIKEIDLSPRESQPYRPQLIVTNNEETG